MTELGCAPCIALGHLCCTTLCLLHFSQGFLGLEDILSQGIVIIVVIVIIIIPAFFCSEAPFLTGGFVSRTSLLPQHISHPCSPFLGLEGVSEDSSALPPLV